MLKMLLGLQLCKLSCSPYSRKVSSKPYPCTIRPGLVSLNSSQEKDVGGLLKNGNTARTTQMANIRTFSHKANLRKYSVSDTLDPADGQVALQG